MWQSGRPKVCVPCGKVRWEIATDAARAAVAAHARECRLRLVERRRAALAASGDLVAVLPPAGAPPGGAERAVG